MFRAFLAVTLCLLLGPTLRGEPGEASRSSERLDKIYAAGDRLTTRSVPHIEIDELAKKKNVLLLDARSREEFRLSHLRGAQRVGYEDFDLKKLGGVPRSQKIVVYCSIGYRSGEIGKQLQSEGFKNVRNLRGGIFAWVTSGRLVVTGSGGQTERVHGFDETWGQLLRPQHRASP